MLFGSLVLPLAVLMSLPLSVVGAFGAMALTHTPLTLFSLLGFAVLVGLVGKNAILLVDYTEILRARGYERTAAIKEAGPTRLRPIVMTTMSVMVALMPIASGLEEGSELLQAAAVVLIGGLLTSTLLTLVFVPAMYTIFDDMQNGVVRFARWVSRKPAPSPVADTRTAHGAHANVADGAEHATVPASEAVTASAPALDGHAATEADGRHDRDGQVRPAERSPVPPTPRPEADERPIPPEPAGSGRRQ
jgi:HAE1 family hydrophobic/amphiphilic exporter-1